MRRPRHAARIRTRSPDRQFRRSPAVREEKSGGEEQVVQWRPAASKGALGRKMAHMLFWLRVSPRKIEAGSSRRREPPPSTLGFGGDLGPLGRPSESPSPVSDKSHHAASGGQLRPASTTAQEAPRWRVTPGPDVLLQPGKIEYVLESLVTVEWRTKKLAPGTDTASNQSPRASGDRQCGWGAGGVRCGSLCDRGENAMRSRSLDRTHAAAFTKPMTRQRHTAWCSQTINTLAPLLLSPFPSTHLSSPSATPLSSLPVAPSSIAAAHLGIYPFWVSKAHRAE